MDASAGLRAGTWVVKVAAMVCGLAITVPCLMSIIALASRNVIIQLVPSLLVAVGVPLVVAERLGHDSRGRRREGLATDVLALSWLGFALLFVVLAHPLTRPMLLHEAELLTRERTPLATHTASALVLLARGRAGRSITGLDMAVEEATGLGVGVTPRRAPDAGVQVIEFDAGASVDVDARAATDGGGLDGGDAGDSAAEADGSPPPAPERVAPTIAEALAGVLPSVVTVSVCRRDGGYDSGSGFVLDEGGTIATADELVRDAQSAAVRLADGRWLRRVALIARDARLGVALLSTASDLEGRAPRLGHEEALRSAASVIVAGNPLGLEPTVRLATLEAPGGDDAPRVMVLSQGVHEGAVGGPVVDGEGAIVGIAVRGSARRSLLTGATVSVGLAVPIDALLALEPLSPPRRLHGRGVPPPLVW